MSSHTGWQPGDAHLDLWLRKTAIFSTGNASERAALAQWPLRQVIQYRSALGLADTLEHAAKHSLHYAQTLGKKPGSNIVAPHARKLREAAAQVLAFSSCKGASTAKTSAASTCEPVLMLSDAIRNALDCLPFTRAAELASAPESFLAVGHDDVAALMSFASSGSTGPGKRVFCTEQDLEGTVAFFEHGMRYLLRPDGTEKVALLMSTLNEARGGNLGLLFSRALERLGVPCLVAGFPVDEADMLRSLSAFAPTCIVGLPRHILSMFRHCAAESGGVWPSTLASGLRTVLLSGDSISHTQVKIIEQELQCRVFRHYGMAETGLGTAVECAARDGCHWREQDFLFEIVTEDGRALLPGQDSEKTTPWGEIAVTTLTRQGTPLLRYLTGDIGRAHAAPCSCGSALWRLEVRERKANMPRFGNIGQGISAADFDACLYPLPWVKDYDVALGVRPGADALAPPEALLCEVSLSRLAPDNAPDLLRGALSALARRLSYASCALYVRPAREGGLPLSGGKQAGRCSPKRIFRHVCLPFGPEAVRL